MLGGSYPARTSGTPTRTYDRRIASTNPDRIRYTVGAVAQRLVWCEWTLVRYEDWWLHR